LPRNSRVTTSAEGVRVIVSSPDCYRAGSGHAGSGEFSDCRLVKVY
jgi:hypothetical protein